MAWKSIVALADGESADAQTLAFAGRLSHDYGALVKVVAGIADPAVDLINIGLAFGAPYTSDVGDALAAARRDQAKKVSRALRQACADFSLAIEPKDGQPGMTLIEPDPFPAVAVARLMSTADLAVVGQDYLDSPRRVHSLFADILLGARTPVLVGRGDTERLTGTVAVAWDGSLEAGRALRAALPMLVRAERVVVLQCREGLEAFDADPSFAPLRDYLKLHGVVGIERVELPEGPEGETLLRTACLLHASVLVAGAYGHTRLREAAFGGATRTFIEATDSPSLLLAH